MRDDSDVSDRSGYARGVRDARGDSDVRRASEIASPHLASPQVSHAPVAPHAAPTAAAFGAGNPPQVSHAPVAPHAAPTAASAAPASPAAPVAPPVAAPARRTRIIGAYGGFRKTISFAYVCLVYHATTKFCERNYSYKTDPLGKTSGQMVGAARSARQNVVEGSSRAGTSKETELRLYDVAKASLAELAGDSDFFSTQRRRGAEGGASVAAASEMPPYLRESSRLGVGAHLQCAHRCWRNAAPVRRWRFLCVSAPLRLKNEAIAKSSAGASAMRPYPCTVVGRHRRCRRAESLSRGFAIATVEKQLQGRKMVARKGRNAGQPFWSCRNYPNCKGTRPWGRSRWAE